MRDLYQENGGDGRAGTVLTGTVAGENTGYSVAGAGDVNNDGIDDVAIGSGSDMGARVIFGRRDTEARIDVACLDGTNGFHLIGGQFGGTIRGAGDINGDGISDLIVGSFQDAAYVIFGRNGSFPVVVDVADLDGTNGFRVGGFGQFGGHYRAVSAAGDINGDGFDDVAIGASFAGSGGRVFVVFGQSNFSPDLEMSALDGTNGFRIDGRGGRFGESVSYGDFNGDGLGDLLVGAHTYSGLLGEAYVLLGSRGGFDPLVDVSRIVDGTTAFRLFTGLRQHFATDVASGDVNGDGIDDIIVGAQGTRNGVDPGHAYVLFGKRNAFDATIDFTQLEATDGFVINGVNADDFAGATVASADVNSDGLDDIIVGALEADPHGANTGEVYIVFGTNDASRSSLDLASLDGNNGWTIRGVRSGDKAGTRVSSAGDFNGDGVEDLIIGAWSASRNGLALVGESYVVFGCRVVKTVVIDVKPESNQNKVNTKSQGVLPVAVMTTPDFDAGNAVASTLQLWGIGASHWAQEDVDNDHNLDLILHFAVQDLIAAIDLDLGSGEERVVDAKLTGQTTQGASICGTDKITFFRAGKGNKK